jgi:hypothetical protein
MMIHNLSLNFGYLPVGISLTLANLVNANIKKEFGQLSN